MTSIPLPAALVAACVAFTAVGARTTTPPGPDPDPGNGEGSGVFGESPSPALPQQILAVLDIAHATQFSDAMMQRTPTAAAQWLVNEHLSKAASRGVTHVILRNPYRWRPQPAEDNRFGGMYPERRTALHAAIAAARAQGKPMPLLACYQTLPKGDSLSAADKAILDSQLVPFNEDEWEAMGCAEWQQDMLDARRLLRPQYLEPIWARGFPRQWTYPIDVTEEFMSRPKAPFQLYPDPCPEIRCSMYRTAVPLPGETPRETALRNARKFLAYCIPKNFVPMLPIDLYTAYDATASEIYIVNCAADYDGSGFVNGADLDEYLFDFAQGSRFADMDSNGYTNGEDFDHFVSYWISGC